MHIASSRGLRNPLLLLSSITAFDLHLGRYLSDGGATHAGTATELKAIRAQLGFDRILSGQSMPTTREIMVGQRLQVWPANGGPKGFCPCVVTDLDDFGITAAPLLRIDEAHLAGLQAGDPIKVRFWRRGDTEYRFRTQILEENPKTTTVVMAHARRLERIQKRDFLRHAVHFDISFRIMADLPAGQAGPVAAKHTGQVSDLSGGGLRMRTTVDLPVDAVLEIVASPDDFPLVGLQCRVIDQRPDHGALRTRVIFEHFTPRQQDEIVGALQDLQIRRGS